MQFIEEVDMNWNKISPQLKSTREQENKNSNPITHNPQERILLPPSGLWGVPGNETATVTLNFYKKSKWTKIPWKLGK